MICIDTLLEQMKTSPAAQLLVMAGDIPAIRTANAWTRLPLPRCTPHEVERQVRRILTPDQWTQLQEARELEFDYAPAAARINIHFQRGSLALLARLIPQHLPA